MATIPQTLPTTSGKPVPSELERVLKLVEIEAANFAFRFIPDDKLRLRYIRETANSTNRIRNAVRTGAMTARDGAEQASAMRNLIMKTIRSDLSDVGLAVSRAQKEVGLGLDLLQERYAGRLFGRTFSELGTGERNQVFLKIIEKAGEPNPEFNILARRLGNLGRGFAVLTLAVSAYNIANAKNKPLAVAREGTTFGASLAGAAAGGEAGLLCGPGAVVCVPIGVFVGGALAAFGADALFVRLWGRP